MTLYTHQTKAIDELKTGKILNGSVGSGKSITALAYFYTKVCDGEIEPKFKPLTRGKNLYVITTAKKRDSKEWDKELSHFCLSTNDVSSKLNRISCIVDSWNNIGKYSDVYNSFFIFDEDRVTGYGSWVKNFLKISKNNDWIILSATPGDKWEDYIPVFIANGFYKNKTDFARNHLIINTMGGYPKVTGYLNERWLRMLRERILVNMDYASDKTINEEFKYVGYNKEKYNYILKERYNIFDDKPYKQASDMLYGLRRICNDNYYKLDLITEIRQKFNRVIIFYNFDYELDLLKEYAMRENVTYGEYNGHQHDLVPNDDSWLYFVQYMAGSEGWNCTVTNCIIFMSPTYSYKQFKQAKGRIDRINTPFNELNYFILLTDSSIDKQIIAALKRKKDFNVLSFIQKEYGASFYKGYRHADKRKAKSS